MDLLDIYSAICMYFLQWLNEMHLNMDLKVYYFITKKFVTELVKNDYNNRNSTHLESNKWAIHKAFINN